MKTAKRAGRWILGTLCLIAAVGVVLWWGIPPREGSRSLRYERGQPPDGAEGGIAFHAAKLESANNLQATTATSRRENSRFACRTILVRNESDHPLVRRAAEGLWQELQDIPFVDRVDLVHPGQPLPSLGSRPDLYVTIDADQLDIRSLPGRRVIHAEIRVSAASTPASSRVTFFDGLNPPVLQFGWEATLAHDSTMVGVESSAARFGLAAASIAEELAGSLTGVFTDYQNEDGLLPDLPPALYPPYREPPAFGFLDDTSLEILADGSGMMVRADTTWSFRRGEPVADVLHGIRAELEDAGWSMSRFEVEENGLPGLRMKDGARVLSVWPEKVEAVGGDSAPPQGSAPVILPARTWFVRYRDRMTRPELEAAVEGLLDKDTPLEVLILFRRNWSPAVRTAVLERLEREGPGDPGSWALLADLYRREGRKDDARLAVRRAYVSSVLAVQDPVDLDDAAKDLGMTDWNRTPDVTELEAAGGTVLARDRLPVERLVGWDEVAMFVLPRTGEPPEVHAVTLLLKGDQGKLRHATGDLSGSRSWSEQAAPHEPGQSRTLHWGGPETGSGRIRVERLEEGRFRMVTSWDGESP